MKKTLSMEEQKIRARLIAPFFLFLRVDKQFLEGVKKIRTTFGISTTKPGKKNVPPHILNLKYWKPDITSRATLKYEGPEIQALWIEFHKEIESLAQKYCLSNFPDLIKDFVLNGRFGDAFLVHGIRLTSDGHTITLPISIRKKDFMGIWKHIEEFNEERRVKERHMERYSKEIQDKYKHVEAIERKYLTDQKDIFLLVKKELFGQLTQDEESEITKWDKSKKSRSTKLAKNLSSLITDLDEAER